MYKRGDKVRLIKFSKEDNIIQPNFTLNIILKVNSVNESEKRIWINLPDSFYDWYVPFECIGKIPNTEIDYLDCFKNNFKEGV